MLYQECGIKSPPKTDWSNCIELYAIQEWNLKIHYRVFVKTRHLTLCWDTGIKFTTSHPASLRSILIFPSHLFLRVSNCLFPSILHTKKNSYAFLLTKINGTRAVLSVLLVPIILIIKMLWFTHDLMQFNRLPENVLNTKM